MTSATATAVTRKPGHRSLRYGLAAAGISLVLLIAFLVLAQAVPALESVLFLAGLLLLTLLAGVGAVVVGGVRRLLARS